ncbi:MAG: hypothetical protein AAGN46_01450 [Acidobacteriota bacterium]
MSAEPTISGAPLVQYVAVVYNPLPPHDPGHENDPAAYVSVAPDTVRVSSTRKDHVCWQLLSPDAGARIEAIDFGAGAPLQCTPRPDDGRVVDGKDLAVKSGTYKYDVLLVTGDGKKIKLDPALVVDIKP